MSFRFGLTWRNYLIILHDAIVTTAAVLASFYLRFEMEGLSTRLPILLFILPYFILFSIVVFYFSKLAVTSGDLYPCRISSTS